MGLQELNDKLHGRELHLDRAREHTPFEPGQGAVDQETVSQFQKTEEWQKPAAATVETIKTDFAKQYRRRRIVIVLGSIAGLILLGGLVFKIRSMLFDENRVVLGIDGPKNVASAEPITFTLTYDNNNLITLNDVTVVLSYPEAFHLEADGNMKVTGLRAEIPIGKINPNAHEKTSITGKFYGSKGDLVYLRATLRYTPSNISSVFEKTTQFGINVATSPLSLEITAPQEMATGQDVEYVVDYSNTGDMAFSNLRVKMVYPDGFSFVSAEPRPSEGNTVWYLGNLTGNAGGKIIIRGVLTGNRDEYKKVNGSLGFFQGDGNFVSYSTGERQTRIIASPLSISQTVNGLLEVNAAPGDVLNYVIHYQNDGQIGLRDAIVTLELDASLLDLSRLSLTRGTYNQAHKMFVWKASDVPSLARLEPGTGGEIFFSVPVANSITSQSSIRSVAKIDSPDVPTAIGSNKIIGSSTLYVKLSSLVTVDLKGFYRDAMLSNTGPVPPVVGQETTYTLHLSITNSANELTGAQAAIAFPTGIQYKGKSLPDGETVTFNDRTNELVWDMGTLSPGNKRREIIFQVGLTPLPNQVDKEAALVNSTVFTAKDTFTGQDIRIEKGTKGTFLPEDASISAAGGQVQPAASS